MEDNLSSTPARRSPGPDGVGPDGTPSLTPQDLDAAAPITIRSPGDVLAYIPHALGEWPTESLVVVALERDRLGAAVRIGLPAEESSISRERTAQTLAECLSRDGRATGAVAAVYTSKPWTGRLRPPRAGLLAALGVALAARSMPLLQSWVVGEEHWRNAFCGDTGCCPWPGLPVEGLRTSRISAELVYRGSAYGLPGPSAPLGGPSAPASTGDGDDLEGSEAISDDPDVWWDPSAFTAALAVWEAALSDGAAPSGERLRLLGMTLSRPALRDAVMVAAAADAAVAWRGSAFTGALRPMGPFQLPPELPGGLPPRDVVAAVDRWRRATVPSPTVLFAKYLMGRTPHAPSWKRIARLESILGCLAQGEDAAVRAPSLAMLAWVHWVRGRGSHAQRLAERALRVDSRYRLAQLLLEVIRRGDVVPWALHRETAWDRSADAA